MSVNMKTTLKQQKKSFNKNTFYTNDVIGISQDEIKKKKSKELGAVDFPS